jgi:MATE family multidrug resistance protein
MAEGGGCAVVGLMLAGLGAVALAANQIVQAVMAVLYMLPLGLATATALRISHARGEGAHTRRRPVLLAAVMVVVLWMAAVIALSVLGGDAMARLLSSDPEVIALATLLFLVLAIMQVFDGVQSAPMGALRGLLDTRWPMAVTLISYWLIVLPAARGLGFVAGFGAPGVWLGYMLGVVLAAIILPWRFLHQIRTRQGTQRWQTAHPARELHW